MTALPAPPVDPLPTLEVSGGTSGLDAQLTALEELAVAYDDTAAQALAWAGAASAAVADPALVVSAPWGPGTFAVVEATLLRLTAGPTGLVASAAAWTALETAVREAADLVREADEAARALVERTRHRVAYEVAYRVGGEVRDLGGEEYLPEPGEDPTALLTLLDRLGGGGGTGRGPDLGAWALDHPDQAELLVGAGGGFLEGLWDSGGPATPGTGRWALPTVGAAAGAVALWFRADRPLVTQVGGETRRPGAPHLAGLVADLDRVNQLSPPERPEGNGTIEIQRHGEGEDVSWVVLLPGTDDLLTRPDEQGTDARDLGTNLASLAGRPTVHTEGIAEAMRAAGVDASSSVTFVGHSQGGMAGVQLAASGEFAVEHVVTLGSPVALMPEVPDGVQVTSLENTSDLVPHLDGAPNPDRAEHLTVEFDTGATSLEEAHSLDGYAAGAAAADRSHDPAVVHQVDDLRALGAIGDEGPVTATTWQITRDVAG